MTGYTIIYWGDTEEVSFLDWPSTHEPGDEDDAAQFERINPAFARFLTANQITEVLEHNPTLNLVNDDLFKRIKYWEDQLETQGYAISR